MNKVIQSCIKALNFATREEIYKLLEEEGKVNKQLVDEKLADLINKEVLLKVLPEENALGLDGFMPGPNLEDEVETKIHKKIIDEGLEKKDSSILYIDIICRRLEKDLMHDLEELKIKIANIQIEPRKLELEYFSLNIRYHSWRRFFYENFEYMPFKGFRDSLNQCRSLLDNLQIE